MDTPGVWVQKTNHGGGSPFIRGLVGNQILVLVDGIRLNNATLRYGPNQYLATVDPVSDGAHRGRARRRRIGPLRQRRPGRRDQHGDAAPGRPAGGAELDGGVLEPAASSAGMERSGRECGRQRRRRAALRGGFSGGTSATCAPAATSACEHRPATTRATADVRGAGAAVGRSTC